MDLVPVEKGERGSLTTGLRWTVRPRPGSDGKYGRLQAINLEGGKSGVGRPPARAGDDRHAGDRGRPRVCRVARPTVSRLRRREGARLSGQPG
jgi:hypothetical protein